MSKKYFDSDSAAHYHVHNNRGKKHKHHHHNPPHHFDFHKSENKFKRKFFSWIKYAEGYIHATLFKQIILFIVSFFAFGFLLQGYFEQNLILAIIFLAVDLYIIKQLLYKRARPTKMAVILIVLYLAFFSADLFSEKAFDKVGVTSFFDGNFVDANFLAGMQTTNENNSNFSDGFVLTTINDIGESTGNTIGNISEDLFAPPDIDEIEDLIYVKTNELRKSKRLGKLTRHAKLDQIARAHSQDMGDRDYFSHDSPEGDGPTERAKKAGISVEIDFGNYIKVGIGENISMVPIASNVVGCSSTYNVEGIAECAFDGWVDSPGHYANMIDSEYREIGVGVAIVNGTAYLTQDFRWLNGFDWRNDGYFWSKNGKK